MRKSYGKKALIFPLPVLIVASYNEDGSLNAMNAAWGTVCDTNKIAIFLCADHKSTKNILSRKAFTVSMATADYVAECDYVGIVSANDVPNKMDKVGFTAIKSDVVDAPIIKELPLTLECTLESFDEESECAVGVIENVSVDESILDENGKIDFSKYNPLAYLSSDHAYVTLGKRVGTAFSDGLKLK